MIIPAAQGWRKLEKDGDTKSGACGVYHRALKRRILISLVWQLTHCVVRNSQFQLQFHENMLRFPWLVSGQCTKTLVLNSTLPQSYLTSVLCFYFVNVISVIRVLLGFTGKIFLKNTVRVIILWWFWHRENSKSHLNTHTAFWTKKKISGSPLSKHDS